MISPYLRRRLRTLEEMAARRRNEDDSQPAESSHPRRGVSVAAAMAVGTAPGNPIADSDKSDGRVSSGVAVNR